jgi:hypothetical protein
VHIGRITPLQKAGYMSFASANPGKKMTIEDMVKIEVKAMTDANIPEDIATGWVIKSLEDLKSQGVTQLTRIPWVGINQ